MLSESFGQYGMTFFCQSRKVPTTMAELMAVHQFLQWRIKRNKANRIFINLVLAVAIRGFSTVTREWQERDAYTKTKNIILTVDLRGWQTQPNLQFLLCVLESSSTCSYSCP